MSVKLYQNVLDFSTTAENFLTIDCAGCSAEVPEGFWRSLVDSPENVQRYAEPFSGHIRIVVL